MHTDSALLQRFDALRSAFADIQENAYIHHTAVPVAVTAVATISPIYARGRFPDTRLADVVLKRPHMDRGEAAALAAICGERIPELPDPDARGFVAHLLDVVDRHSLGGFYGRYPGHPACYGIDVRPHGIDWRTREADDGRLRAWRRAYGKLEPAKQMMVATIMWLYMGREECGWLRHLTRGWHAADAVATMKAAGTLGDWGKLVALYQGW
jgi:hypothetical protein